MGKYDELKDPADIIYHGSKFDSALSVVHQDGDETIILSGLQDCPDCEVTMNRDFFRNQWSCPKCHHAWDTESLIRRLKEKREEYDCQE